jgi:hypothetical protein
MLSSVSVCGRGPPRRSESWASGTPMARLRAEALWDVGQPRKEYAEQRRRDERAAVAPGGRTRGPSVRRVQPGSS